MIIIRTLEDRIRDAGYQRFFKSDNPIFAPEVAILFVSNLCRPCLPQFNSVEETYEEMALKREEQKTKVKLVIIKCHSMRLLVVISLFVLY